MPTAIRSPGLGPGPGLDPDLGLGLGLDVGLDHGLGRDAGLGLDCGRAGQKSDQDPAAWMPAPVVRCRYIGEWVATKYRWALAVDQAEREALLRYAAGCPNAVLAFERAS
ncbi:hypothetical protein ACIA8F_38680 [Streptomyces sp. NPDC051563]|uniref:hypothetical protein n=1 Tax=Streptomyces sp. NPDC051563 TaxID=3365659 RepID=UPI00379D6F50